MAVKMNFKDYRIISDERQLVVYKVRRGEDGSISIQKTRDGEGEMEATSTVGYYATFRQAFKGIKKDYILGKDVDIQSIDDLIQVESHLRAEFDNLMDKLGPELS